ncbi:MAG: proline iminopeptidase-family hydrolase [marine benthic group bacterium]|nr:proline iminopeptidase-family hydrolase [Candidatus Benthicola marisminoris]
MTGCLNGTEWREWTPHEEADVKRWKLAALTAVAVAACQPNAAPQESPVDTYLDYSSRIDVLSGGARLIPIETPAGTFNVWTKRIGNHPTMKVLLLHGGPGATHEYLEAFDSYLPAAGIEYYYYDQLGSHFSDQPDDPSLWEVDRFVDEVEQVRQALGLGPDNFYLYGQSWGGILAIEYALKYQEHLKGLIISNMMASVPAYNAYAEEVLKPGFDPEALAEIEAFEAVGDFGNPRYVELLMEEHYVNHVLRMPLDEWPEPVNRSFANINADIYVLMQGPSELGLRGTLEEWDRTADLSSIRTPTLVIGARYDTMDPEHMEWMASALPNGRYLLCENGSHLAPYDDQERYFEGLIEFVKAVDTAAP